MLLKESSIFETSKLKIVLQEKQKVSLNFSVNKSCLHEVGIMFFSKNNKHVKSIFGSPLKIKFPLVIGIELLDSNNKIIFNKVMSNAETVHFRYGPNPIRFIVGTVPLIEDNYDVNLSIHSVNADISEFDAYFFASHIPKTQCKKFNL
jgi:hypothetical protein